VCLFRFCFHPASACYACRARYCFSTSVRPSVRHVVVLYLNEYTYRQTLSTVWYGPGSFELYRLYKIPRGTPSADTLNTTEIAHLSRKRYQIGPWLLRITNRKSQIVDRPVSVPMTLKGFELLDANGQIFLGDFR